MFKIGIVDKIIISIIVISFSTLIQIFKIKFPIIFTNFEVGSRSEGFGSNSQWKSKNSKEVKSYEEEQKRDFKRLLLIEMAIAIAFIIFY